MNEQKKKSRRNIVTTLASQLVATACGIVVPRILIGSFGSEAYGISVSITQFLSYITLLEGGIGGVARAELYGPLARKDQKGISTVYHAVRRFFYYVAAFFLVYSLVLGLLYYDVAKVTIFSRPYVFCLVLVISLTTLAKYMGGLANLILIFADQKQYVNNIISIGLTLVNTLAIIILTGNRCDLIWVKLGSSLIFVVRPLLYAVYVRKHYHLPRLGKEKAVLEQKWTGIGQHIAYFLHTNTDVVLLTLFADVRLVAVYSVYSLVVSSIRAIAEASSGGMEAAFGELIAKGQLAALRKAYYRYKVLLTAVTTTLFCCTGILILPFVRLYTRGITDADYIQPLFAVILLTAEAHCGESHKTDAMGRLWGGGDQRSAVLPADAMGSSSGSRAGNTDRNALPGRILYDLFIQTYPLRSRLQKHTCAFGHAAFAGSRNIRGRSSYRTG